MNIFSILCANKYRNYSTLIKYHRYYYLKIFVLSLFNLTQIKKMTYFCFALCLLQLDFEIFLKLFLDMEDQNLLQ